MENNLSNLLNLIVTEEDRRIVDSLLDELKQNIFKTDHSLSRILSNNPAFGYAISSLLPEGFEKIEDKSVLQKAVGDIKLKINQINKVSLSLAIYPNAKILKSLSQFAQKNFLEKVIFDIEINPDIIGGIILAKDGKYFDYSLLKKLNAVFETRKNDVLSLISTDEEQISADYQR